MLKYKIKMSLIFFITIELLPYFNNILYHTLIYTYLQYYSIVSFNKYNLFSNVFTSYACHTVAYSNIRHSKQSVIRRAVTISRVHCLLYALYSCTL